MKTFFLLFLIFGYCHTGKALNPLKSYMYTPDSFGLQYENHFIRVNDSTHLKAWKILPAPAYDKKTTVILACGDAGNMSYLLYHASQLVLKGYTALCFDYRGFGESSPFTIQTGFLYYNEYADDLQSVIAWSKSVNPTYKTGVWAFSMGTLLTAKAVQTQSIDFFIAEGIVYNPFMTAIYIKLQKGAEVLLPEHAEEIPGFYSNISCKMLIISGNLDLICPLSDSKKVSRLGKNRKLIQFKGNHLQGMEALTKKKYGDLYIQAIDKFI